MMKLSIRARNLLLWLTVLNISTILVIVIYIFFKEISEFSNNAIELLHARLGWAIFAGSPYFFGWLFFRKNKYILTLNIVGLLLFLIENAIKIQVIFFPTSSTGGLIFMVMPIYAFLLIMIVGIIIAIISKFTSSKR